MAEATAPFKSATRDDLLAAARRRFLAGEEFDLQTLADQLGISRATAYRWAGNAEALTGAVIADLVDDTFRRVRAEARGRGARRVLDVYERGLRYIAAFQPLREFLESDPQKGLRVIASKDGPVQQRTIDNHQRLLDEEVAKGTLRLPVDSHTMAYALTRIGESFLYADLVSGEAPDIDKAVAIIALILRPVGPARAGRN